MLTSRLENNKVEQMNGKLFLNLNQLNFVDLTGNKCIQEVFDGPDEIASLPDEIEKCEFCEAGELLGTSICKATSEIRNSFEKFQELQIDMLETCINKTSEIEQNSIKIDLLVEKLKAAEDAKNAAENQILLLVSVYEKLDAQREETFSAKTEELRKKVELYEEENHGLLHEIQSKSSEIIEKIQKNNSLEDKIKLLLEACNE